MKRGMTGKLEGKVTLAAGGSAGIGLGIGKRSPRKARALITGPRESELDKAVTANRQRRHRLSRRYLKPR
jgi:short-subunit dehydrogenase involved in D-alanine esterification of teichoic acids